MREARILTALATAVGVVLESMFFVEAVPATSEAPEAEAVAVEIRFDGDPPGRFQMRLARMAAHSIATDFLGEETWSVSDGQRADVAMELANMICGAVLSRLESSACFRLGAPRIVPSNEWPGQAEATRFTVETGNGTLTAAIQLERRICPATAEFVS